MPYSEKAWSENNDVYGKKSEKIIAVSMYLFFTR